MRRLYHKGWVGPLLVTLVAFAVYYLTLAPDLTWANHGVDGGELITAAYTLGIPHPPGYPTYVLLSKLFSYLPVGTIAYRFNLFSAVCMALAAGFVAVLAGRWGWGKENVRPLQLPDFLPPIAAGLTFAFVPLVWGQALIAEVYALNLLFLATLLWALLTKRPLWLAGLLLGLSLTSHLTSYLMLPLALALTPPTQWPRLGVGILAGLSPLLLLPWLAQNDSPLAWSEPVTWRGWYWLVSGRLYHGNALALPVTELLPRLIQWSRSLVEQFAWLGLPLLVVGLAETWSEKKRVYGLFLATAVLYAILSLGYHTEDAAVFFLPGLLLLSILLISGLRWLGPLSLLLPLALLTLNFHKQNLRHEAPIRPQAELLLAEAPPSAILLTPGDQTMFALLYFHYVEKQRPDLILVDSNLLAFEWYRNRLSRQYPELGALEIDDLVHFREYNSQNRWFCTVSLITSDTNRCFKDPS